MFALFFGLLSLLYSCVNTSDETPIPDSLVVEDFSASFEENPSDGDVIGIISASSTLGALSFEITSQTPAGAIAIDASSGEISVANSSLFVIADHPEITASVEVTDGISTASLAVVITLSEGPLIWTGDIITFVKADGADPDLEANQDRITDNVWITRGNDGGPISNAQSDANTDNGPGDTEWAIGTLDDLSVLEFADLRGAIGDGRGAFRDLVGVDLVLHLITDDVYLDVKFTSWSQGMNGGFAYERSTEP